MTIGDQYRYFLFIVISFHKNKKIHAITSENLQALLVDTKPNNNNNNNHE
jgi:hypothetical protein